MKKILFALLILTGFVAEAQTYPSPVIQKPNNSFGTQMNRLVPDSTLYLPTACGVPTDTTWLFSQGTSALYPGYGQKMKKAAVYYDSCGHHEYIWDPSLQAWHIADSSSGGGSSYTADETTLHLAGNQFSINTGYQGQSSIINLGTVTSGIWNSTAIADAYIASSATWNAKLTSVLSSARIFVGNGSNVASPVAMSGAGSMNNAGVLSLTPTVTAGSCTNCNLTYNAAGQLTVAANGSGDSGGNPFSDNAALVQNSADHTRLLILSAASIPTGTTNTWTFPGVNGTVARNDAAQTFAGIQTFTLSPIVPSPSAHDSSFKVAPTIYVDQAAGRLQTALADSMARPFNLKINNIGGQTPISIVLNDTTIGFWTFQAGTNVTFDTTSHGILKINSSGSGSSLDTTTIYQRLTANADSIAAIKAKHRYLHNYNWDPAADTLLTSPDDSDAYARQIQDTSTDGSVSISKTLSNTGVIYHNFHVNVSAGTGNDTIDQRQGVVVAPGAISTSQNNIQEPNVDYLPTPELGTPGDSCYKTLVDGGWSVVGVYYGEGPDGRNFIFNQTPIIANHDRASMFYVGDSIYVLAAPTTSQTQIDLYGGLITNVQGISLIHSNIIHYQSGSSTGWDSVGIFNSGVVPVGSKLYMLVDGLSLTNGYMDGLYTANASDVTHWTAYAGNPVTDLTSVTMKPVNGNIWLWGHKSPKPTGGATYLPTDIYRQVSTDTCKQWTYNPFQPTFPRWTKDEGADSVNGQVADICVFQHGDSTYFFYDATRDGLDQGSTNPGLQIKLAVAAMPLSQLVNTNENAYALNQWESYNSTSPTVHARVYTAFNAGNVSIRAGIPDSSAILYLGNSTSEAAALRFKLSNTILPTHTGPGMFIPKGNNIYWYDSLGIQHLIANQDWVTSVLPATGFEAAIHNNPSLTQTDTVHDNGHIIDFLGGTLQSDNFALDPNATTPLANLNTGELIGNTSSTHPTILIGGGLTLGAYSGTNAYLGFNLGYNAGYNYMTSGPGAIIQGVGGGLYFGTAVSGTAAAAASIVYPLYISPAGSGSGNVTVNSGEQDWGNAALQSNSFGGNQLGLYYSNVKNALFQVDGAANLNLTGLASLTLPTASIPLGSSSDTALVIETISGVSTFKKALISGGGGASAANPTGTIGLSTVNGTASTFLRSDGAPPLSQAITPTWTGLHTWNLGNTSTTVTPALFLNNSTASTSGATAQYSYALGFGGTGWVTGSSASQATKDLIYNVTASGSVQPSNNIYVDMSHNGGSYTHALIINEGGGITVVGGGNFSANVLTCAACGYSFGTGTQGGIYGDSTYGIAIRQGTNPEEFRLLNTYTAVGNQGGLKISYKTASNVATISTFAYGAAAASSINHVSTESFVGTTTLGGYTQVGNILVDTTTGTVVYGSGSGTGASSGANYNAGNNAGVLDFTTGTSPSASATILTLTFNVSWGDGGNTPVVLSPANAAAAALSGNANIYANCGNSALILTSGSTALAASTEYKWNYMIMGHVND